MHTARFKSESLEKELAEPVRKMVGKTKECTLSSIGMSG